MNELKGKVREILENIEYEIEVNPCHYGGGIDSESFREAINTVIPLIHTLYTHQLVLILKYLAWLDSKLDKEQI